MRPSIMIVVLSITSHSGAQSQVMKVGPDQPLRLLPSDSTVLELHKLRHELPCSVQPYKPRLGFDLMFHSGFRVSLPTKALAGAENMLTILFRVTPAKHRNRPTYFFQSYRVPLIQSSRRGRVELSGLFLVGEGKYSVDWLMRDLSGRFCTGFWDLEAKTGAKEERAPAIARDVIESVRTDPFAGDPVIERSHDGERSHDRRLLSIAIIVNYNRPTLGRLPFTPTDRSELAAILRVLGRDPGIGRYSVLACSLQTGQVLYRQDPGPNIDLPGLGQALDPATLASVSVKQLTMKHGFSDFIADLIAKELDRDLPDAFIFISPECPLDFKIPRDAVSRFKSRPVFYLNLSLNQSINVGRSSSEDVFGRLARQMHAVEYPIRQPLDLFKAWSDIRSRITRAAMP
jgi:hypothetical protein